MLFFRRTAGLVSIVILLSSVTACANSPNAKNLERILAADPKLRENPVNFGNAGTSSQRQTPVNNQLPSDFPEEIPLYPNAQLKAVIQPTSQGNDEFNNSAQPNEPQQTVWTTSDPINLVQNFYQQQFQAKNWEIVSEPSANSQAETIEASLNDLQVTVAIQPITTANTDVIATPTPSQTVVGQNQPVTQYTIEYTRNVTETDTTSRSPAPSIADPSPSSTPTVETPTPVTTDRVFTDLNQVAPQLRQYITDLAALGVLPQEQTSSQNKSASTTTQFNPNKIINRREFARWLFAANNQIYSNRPSQQIRTASLTSQPAFQDVPRTDPDFAVIQGLAEAGIVPSPLSGDATAVLFRSNAPLTREQLILWKAPLDTRQSLPKASVDAVKETWGFQDVAKIEPNALRAVLADFQNGEQSNIKRVFGYTTLFQPKKPVTRAEAAAALWYFGSIGEGISAQEALQIQRQPNQPAATPQPSATPAPSSSIPVNEQ